MKNLKSVIKAGNVIYLLYKDVKEDKRMKSLAERVLQWNKEELFSEVITSKYIYQPVWECEGEKLSEYECFFLILIKENPGITVNELKEKGGRTQGAISQRLIDFEKKGFLQKNKKANDRRHTEVKLTPKGERIAEEVISLKLRHSQDAIDVWMEYGYTEEEIRKFIDMYTVIDDYSNECRERIYGV